MIPSDGNATEVTFVQVYSRRPFMGVEYLGESHFQKPISIFCFGQKAAVALAEDAVAVAGNHFVSPVAKPPGDDSQQGCRNGPMSTYLSQYGNDGVGAHRNPFLGPTAVFDEVYGIQIAGIEAMTLKDSAREIALQGGEAETTVGIALQAELDQTVAESANSIVDKDRIGRISCHGHGTGSGQARGVKSRLGFARLTRS